MCLCDVLYDCDIINVLYIGVMSVCVCVFVIVIDCQRQINGWQGTVDSQAPYTILYLIEA